MTKKCSNSVIHRFTGRGSKSRVIDAFRNQDIVAGELSLAKKLASQASIQDWKKNRDVMQQGWTDDEIYFILSGAVSIIANGREIAKREAGQHVGEMALLDLTARRSVTVRTLEPTITAKITERAFTRIANANPQLWRNIANTLAQRLRERNKFHTVPRNKPVVFIGSSTEGLPAAEAIYNYLNRLPCVPRLWADGVFECSKTTVEELMNIIKESDFAIIIFSPDDVTKSRGTRKPSPRDNVIFELGLFMGALSRERTYIVAPKNVHIKIPTDLLGVTLLTYHKNKGKTISRCLSSVKRELYKMISKKGPI